MQASMRPLTLSIAATVLFCITQPIYAQGNDPLAAIQQKLQEHITLSTLDSNGDIATAGSVVTLLKSSLQMAATVAPANAGTPTNTYKNGKLSAGMFSWSLGLGLLHIDPNTIPMHTSVAGEKFWIVLYNVKKNGVDFKIWTDPDANNYRYWTWLSIPFDKKQTPSPDEFMKTLAEVLSMEAAQDQGTQPPAQGDAGQSASILGKYIDNRNRTDYVQLGLQGIFTLFQSGKTYSGSYTVAGNTVICAGPKIRGLVKLNIVGNTLTYQDGTVYEKQGDTTPVQDSAAAPAPAAPPAPSARQYDEVAPPPTPPAPAPTITIGELKAQVLTDFGEPQRKAATGPKEIFFYTDLKMKVTFINGKVSSID